MSLSLQISQISHKLSHGVIHSLHQRFISINRHTKSRSIDKYYSLINHFSASCLNTTNRTLRHQFPLHGWLYGTVDGFFLPTYSRLHMHILFKNITVQSPQSGQSIVTGSPASLNVLSCEQLIYELLVSSQVPFTISHFRNICNFTNYFIKKNYCFFVFKKWPGLF